MSVRILRGDCRDVLKAFPDASVHCVVTSPPYFGLRSYLPDGHPDKAKEIGLEETPDQFVAAMVEVFREVRRVLRDDGTFWLNLGDSYANDGKWGGHTGGKHAAALHCSPLGRNKRYSGLKPKDLIGIPWMVAFALRADGWYLRKDIIWHKPNPMPESVTDRPTSAHEHVFLFAKSERYFYDADAIREAEAVPDWDDGSRVFGGVNKHGANAQHGDRTTGRRATVRKRGLPPRHAQYDSSDQSGLDEAPRGGGRNARDVWTIATRPFPDAHFATFPPDLAERCIKAGCPERCCPQCGSPWWPISERVDQGYDGSRYGERAVDATGGAKNGGTARSTLGSSNGKLVGRREIKGYEPRCSCPNHDPARGVVLDPFGGAGTVGMVADRLQRDAALIELHPDYPDLATRRIVGDGGMFSEVA